MRNKALIGLIGMSLVVALLGSGYSSQLKDRPANSAAKQGQAEFKEVRMGIVPLPHYAHMWVAKKKGFIDEELHKAGFALKWMPFSLGPMVNEAFASERVDMGVMGDFPALVGRSAGTDYEVVAIASAAPKALALVVKQDSAVTKVRDLQGLKVATTKGAYGQKLLSLLLEKNNLTMKDIHFIHMSMEDLAPALLRGDIDAGVIWDPLITRLEEAGEIKVIADGTNIYDAYAVLMASTAMIRQNPQAVRAVLEAYRRGNEYLRQHPDESIALLMEDMKIAKPQLLKIIEKFNYDSSLTATFINDMKSTEQFMHKNGLLRTRVDVHSFIHKQ